MWKGKKTTLRLLKSTIFKTAYTSILRATTVNELLDPLILWPHQAWRHEGMETFFHTSRSISPFQSPCLACHHHPALKGKTSKKLNNYEKKNKEKGSLSFFWCMKLINNIQTPEHWKVGYFQPSLGNSNKSHVWCPLISDTLLYHSISSINLSSDH